MSETGPEQHPEQAVEATDPEGHPSAGTPGAPGERPASSDPVARDEDEPGLGAYEGGGSGGVG